MNTCATCNMRNKVEPSGILICGNNIEWATKRSMSPLGLKFNSRTGDVQFKHIQDSDSCNCWMEKK